MNLELCGYFDHNFGDDYIQRIAAHYLSDYELSIDPDNGENVSLMLLREPNVSLKSNGGKNKYPKILVTGSGFMVNSLNVLKYEIVWFLKSKHIADFCIGCNIEPFKNKFSEWLIIQKLKKFRYIICRDKKSLQWLRKNCPNTESEYMPDILFAMPVKWLPEKPFGDKLGIAMIKFGDDGGEYYRKMAEAADYWIETTGKGVILLAFDVGSEDDVSVCEKTRQLIKRKDMVEIAMHGEKGEILEAFSKCRKIAGARFHSGVLSIKMGIDFYPVIYRQKMQNLITDTEYPVKGCFINAVDLEDIKRFLNEEKVNFKLDESYETRAGNGFEALKRELKKV